MPESDDDRMARLEARVTELEGLVRRLTERPAATAPRPRPATSTPRPPAARAPVAPRWLGGGLDSEEWIGQRGLLAVGVLALVLAAGYLLKLSFDRGWVSPVMRCTGGAVAGGVVGAVGWWLHPRYRTYGAALIGCGAAIIYLAVWAAVREYGFVPPGSGLIALGIISLALASIAYALEVEALGAAAALGAFFAPIFLSPGRGNADALLVYLAAMGLTLGVVAGRRHWKLAALVIAASYFGVGWVGGASGSGQATPALLLAYGVAGGTGGLYLGLRERWGVLRALAFWGGWALIASATGTRAGPSLLLAAGVMAAPLWWRAFRVPRIWPEGGIPLLTAAEWTIGETVYFLVTPLCLAWAIRLQAPERFDTVPGLAAAIVGVPYLLAGYVRPRPAFAMVGLTALGVAAWLHWPGLAATVALLVIGAMAAALDHPLGRTDGRWYALALTVAALLHLTGTDAAHRAVADPAFVGSWALVLWSGTALVAAFAAGLWRAAGREHDVRAIRIACWIGAGALLLFGVTGEIQRYFLLHTARLAAAQLAGGLAVSAWWLVFAASLVALGFARSVGAVRRFGLGVAALAGVKVLVVDLSSLDALYRVGSVLILGLVSLLLAYLYHRQARARVPSGA